MDTSSQNKQATPLAEAIANWTTSTGWLAHELAEAGRERFRIPIQVTTKKRTAQLMRNAFTLGVEAGRYGVADDGVRPGARRRPGERHLHVVGGRP